jgi:Zn-finger nucleic acid-binding protein
MKCPACKNELSRAVTGEVTVDVCRGGCGGVWFDQFELRRMDEPHEAIGDAILDVPRGKGVQVDHGPRRKCPRCPNVPMMRHFHSVRKQVQVDECPDCGGFWLDLGELKTIRSQFKTDEERAKAAGAYFDEIFGVQLTALAAQSEESRRKAQRIAHLFRFLCPSWYIPGKQDWGAF